MHTKDILLSSLMLGLMPNLIRKQNNGTPRVSQLSESTSELCRYLFCTFSSTTAVPLLKNRLKKAFELWQYCL